MLVVTGYNTTIVQSLQTLLPETEEVVRFDPERPELKDWAERWVLAAGKLVPKRGMFQDRDDVVQGMKVNFFDPMALSEAILGVNPSARICIIGSESGYSGSFDDTYGAAKRALHHYVESRKLEHHGQQLVAVAPSIIMDSGMTQRRTDHENLKQREMAHPKRRYLTSLEVAKMIYFLLYEDMGYTSGTVIRMHGGGGK